MAVITAGLGAAATVYSQSAQREKEADLLFVGNQYRDAIASYYERSPGGAKRYPQKLEDLLEDQRYPVLMRHLRRLYKDPVTGDDFAPVEAPGGAGIMGVASRSETEPLKSGNFRPKDESFAEAKTYADWKFTYSPTGLAASQPGNTPGNTTAPAK
ncbi:MAG: type II secretion system protein [Clostridia bacterium]